MVEGEVVTENATTDPATTGACPRCGATASGRFCETCGFALTFVAAPGPPSEVTPSSKVSPLRSRKRVITLLLVGAFSALTAAALFHYVAGRSDRQLIKICQDKVQELGDTRSSRASGSRLIDLDNGERYVLVVTRTDTVAGVATMFNSCSVDQNGQVGPASGFSVGDPNP
jgi:hypothetical protein